MANPRFEGFTDQDFQDTVEGTHWRGRDRLGGVLTALLQERTSRAFQSWAISRRRDVFVAPPDHFGGTADAVHGLPRCKLLVRTTKSELLYGFYIEKGYGDSGYASASTEVMDVSWDWLRFAAALQGALSGELRRVLNDPAYRIRCDIRQAGAFEEMILTVSQGALLSQTNDREPQPANWESFLARILAAGDDTWVDFYLEQAKTPQQAIDRGDAIAADIVQAFVELLPIFDASTPTGSSSHKDLEVLAVRERATEMRSERLTVEQLADYFRMQAGLNFTPYQVAAYVTALQTKGFVILSGLSGTGKTKLAQHFAKLLNPEGDGDNYLFVPVRPDWRENTALIGYYNPLLGTYESTDLLRFVFDAHIQIAEAAKDPATVLPYFILLDEMNLAHVEHYFADFLSVLESGRRADGTSQELVRLHNFEDGKLDATGSSIAMTLRLPPNLYFIGTVNVDETTHSFSPKVLDRAFTIEFDAADLASYPPLPAPGEGIVLPGEALQLLLQSFTRQGEFARIDKFALAAFDQRHPEFMTRLRELEALLRPHELHFGYRTVDEILMYLVNAETYGWFDGLGELRAAFDSAVLMKILPKFHGPRARLREPLLAVLRWAGTTEDIMSRTDNANPKYNEALIYVREWLLAPDFREFPCPRVALKCLRMAYQLHTTGFAAFS